MKMMYDAAVIGGGAAGLTAAESTSTAGTYFGMELDSQKTHCAAEGFGRR